MQYQKFVARKNIFIHHFNDIEYSFRENILIKILHGKQYNTKKI